MDKKLFLCSQVFSDSISTIKTIYKDLVNVEPALEHYLETRRPEQEEKQKEYENKTEYFFLIYLLKTTEKMKLFLLIQK